MISNLTFCSIVVICTCSIFINCLTLKDMYNDKKEFKKQNKGEF